MQEIMIMKLQEMRIFNKQQEIMIIKQAKHILIYSKSTEIPPNISLCLIHYVLPPNPYDLYSVLSMYTPELIVYIQLYCYYYHRSSIHLSTVFLLV